MFFKKNTLTLDEVTDGITFIALTSLAMLIKQGTFLNEKQRVQMWERRKVIYSGKCSNWHASKICVCGDNLARHLASNELLLARAEEVGLNGTQEEKVEWQAEVASIARPLAIQNNLI